MNGVLLTHARQYVGPGAVAALLDAGARLYCHDASFADIAEAEAFEAAHPSATALTAQTPDAIFERLAADGAEIDTVVSNDVHPNTPRPIEDVEEDVIRASFEALFLFPFQLAQRFLPGMKAARAGRFVFVTSARYRQPEDGFSVATSLRQGATAFAVAMAREAAPFGVQVNVMAPNYLYSEAYYPRARFIDDPAGRAAIEATVPMGRLGTPSEAGAVIAFLASGRAPFMTGQVIDFAGGWP